MTSTNSIDQATRKDIIQRLKRIEGQARGIQRMIEEGRDCEEVMNQIAAMRAATQAVSVHLLEEFALQCLQQAIDEPSREKAVTQMISVVSKLAR